MNDADIKTLINSAVDGELAGHRTPPAWDRATLLERPGPARSAPDPARSAPTRRAAAWTVPVLAASAAALLAAGSIVAINHSRDSRSNQVGPASPAPSVSLSESVSTNRDKAAREYSEAVATAVEASEAAGVSVGPLSAQDTARLKDPRLKDTGLHGFDITGMPAPRPGKTYSFTMSYRVGPSDNPPAVLTTEVRDAASGTCAQPFLARPGYAYLIHCRISLLAGVKARATLTLRTPTGTSSDGIEFSVEYSEALASAPEASKVADVSERPASAEELRDGESFGLLGNGPIALPAGGRSYLVPLIYFPPSDAAPISVLAVRFEDVTAGRCPRAFQIRPAHAYVIRCQVTFRAGAVGVAHYEVTGPRGKSAATIELSPP
ncbi:MAG TPA: hypothetical protein VF612_17040 [Jatrophihabitans sp.]|uniref:hypothetical protein n=1 Tax=Jatrophihabitans sp. TaxID=1932789 RepID=UPI002F00B872